jgi:hypothetical protein
MLPHLKVYAKATAGKPPNSSCYHLVTEALKDELLGPKMGFMQSVAVQLEPFLTAYQTDEPLLPFMYDDLHSLLRSLMVRFVDKDVIKSASSATKLMEVDLTNKKNLKKLSDVDIGFAASAACKDVKGLDVLKFREECVTFLKHLCSKLIAKCPLKYKIVRGATCISPDVLCSVTLRETRVATALEVFTEKKRMPPSTADQVKREYLSIFEKRVVQSQLKNFRRQTDRLDKALWNILESENASAHLISFVCQILTLFHGNAAVERSFSINKECLVENLHEDSLIAQRAVHGALMSVGGIASMSITKPMILAVRNASAKRVEALTKKETEHKAQANKLKRIALEIKELEAKKAKVQQQAKDEAQTLDDDLKRLRSQLK